MAGRVDWNPNLPEAIERLALHSHLCLFYETPEEQFEAVVPFIRIGLEHGDRCVYIADENTAQSALEALREGGGGINVDAALDTRALIIATERESYLRQGVFDPDAMIAFLKGMVDAAKAGGFPALRVSSEMSWALGEAPGIERLIEYEAKLNYFLPTHDIMAIGQYNRRRFSSETIHDVIYTHPLIISEGEVYQNFYYIPPDVFLARDRTGSEVEYLLKNLQLHARDRLSLQKANRMLRVLSGVNQLLIRATEESALLSDVCRVVVETGGYRMAWLGFAELDEEKTVRPVCSFGYEAGYLDAVKMTWSDTELGRGPTGTAIRTGKPAFTEDIFSDPRYSPWRDEALKRGYASSAAIPLVIDGQAIGSLNLYSWQPNAFEPEEVKLLTELAGDLAYGIMTRRTREERRRAEDALRESEERFRLVAENAGDAIVMIDQASTILFVSRAAEKVFGYTVDEMLGQKLTMLMPERLRQVHLASIKRYIETGTKHIEWKNVELQGLHKSGTEISLEASYSEYIKNDKHFFVGVIRDITERKRAEVALRESEERYRNLIELSPDAVAVHDSRKLLFVNAAGAALMGAANPDELVGRPVIDFVHPDYRVIAGERIRRMLKEGRKFLTMFEEKFIRLDGTVIDVEVAASPFSYQGKTAVMVVFRDITERKRSAQMEREMETHKREFYRRTILAATQGKLVITDKEEIDRIAGPSIASWKMALKEELSMVRHAVEEIAASAGMDESRIGDLLLCVGEAGTNAIKHAGGGIVSLHEFADGLMVVISDRGPGIEALTLPEATLRLGYSTAGSLGMGYKAIISLADTVYLSTGPSGTTVGIEMKLHKEELRLDVSTLADTWAS